MRRLAIFWVIGIMIFTHAKLFADTTTLPEECGSDATGRVFNTQGSTPLFDAAGKGDLALVKSLVKPGANINQQMTGCWKGWTAVMIAAAEGKPDVVQFLLENKASPNLKNSYGRTALMFASKYGFTSIVKLLLDYKADPNIKPDGPVAILVAAQHSKVAVVKLLIVAGAVVNPQDCKGDYLGACTDIAALYFQVDKNQEAKLLLKPACAAGVRLSCGLLGLVEQKLGNKAEGKRLLAIECEKGDAASCYGLGTVAYNEGNRAEEKRLYRKSCDGKFMRACSHLGFLEKADGNNQEADRLLTLSCDGGEQAACKAIHK